MSAGGRVRFAGEAFGDLQCAVVDRGTDVSSELIDPEVRAGVLAGDGDG
jgi:hypothetical protein